jgi:hypothetical protein
MSFVVTADYFLVEFGDGDHDPPYLANQNPAPGATGVSRNTNVALSIKDDGAGVDLSTVTITLEVLGYDGATNTFHVPYNGPSSSKSGVPAQYDFVLDRTINFGFDTLVTVTVHAADLAVPPNVLNTLYSFRTVAAVLIDAPTAPSAIWIPGITSPPDCRLIQASLTTEGRRYLARKHLDGSILTLSRFVLGGGLPGFPDWRFAPRASPDTTAVVNPLYEGDVQIESANDQTIVITCAGPANLQGVQEVLVYGWLNRSLEFPFAVAIVPEWFPAWSQKFDARIVIPL